jgi:PAS domain-containing protein
MLTVTTMTGADGVLAGFMGVARDITAEAAAQAELADSEERFRLAFDTAPVGMLFVGLTPGAPGTLLRVNATVPRLLGP